MPMTDTRKMKRYRPIRIANGHYKGLYVIDDVEYDPRKGIISETSFVPRLHNADHARIVARLLNRHGMKRGDSFEMTAAYSVDFPPELSQWLLENQYAPSDRTPDEVFAIEFLTLVAHHSRGVFVDHLWARGYVHRIIRNSDFRARFCWPLDKHKVLVKTWTEDDYEEPYGSPNEEYQEVFSKKAPAVKSARNLTGRSYSPEMTRVLVQAALNVATGIADHRRRHRLPKTDPSTVNTLSMDTDWGDSEMLPLVSRGYNALVRAESEMRAPPKK